MVDPGSFMAASIFPLTSSFWIGILSIIMDDGKTFNHVQSFGVAHSRFMTESLGP